ncbi:Zn-ribbon domain-containing OB-fold protein [Nocardia nova]|uniref:Zn-ribbon domain-containing OB-fold protein n=1 Tax=Nocardia nova TaxID=37330 RepID=UPI0011B0932D|nr:OB-fold domain-containing protein [Nocardia nova]
MTTALGLDWLLDPSLAPDAADPTLEPFYTAASYDQLVMPFCTDCGIPKDLDQHICDACGSARTRWRTVESRGTVHSVTVMHRLEPGLVRTDAPYPILDVELTSGHRLIMTTRERTGVAFGIGDPVAIGFRRLGGVAVPAAVPPPAPAHESTAHPISEEPL